MLYTYGNAMLPEGILHQINPDTCVINMEIILSAAPVFNMAFRYNCGRALMMGVRNNSRQPLWKQRLKSAELLEQVVREPEHPLIRETRQECMNRLWDADGGREEQCRIVRRMLRYRGAADVCQTAGRYGWNVQTAGEILAELCRRGEAVKEDDIYYHAELYRRAIIRTLKNRREEVQTCPPEAYAALLLSRMETSAPTEESLRSLLKRYAGTTLPVSYWEGILLPRWVNNYRAAKLDAYLAEGELFWHMADKGGLRFDYQEEIDWDAGFPETSLSEKEQLLYLTLQRRGADILWKDYPAHSLSETGTMHLS